MIKPRLRRLAPGEEKILDALGQGDLGYSSLKRQAGLKSDSKFSQYLKNLGRAGLIQHDFLTRRYRLTQPGGSVAKRQSILKGLASQGAPSIIREVVRPLISTEEGRQIFKAGDAFTTVTRMFEKERRQVDGMEVVELEGPLPLLAMLNSVNRRVEIVLFMDNYSEKAEDAFKGAKMEEQVNVFFDRLTSTFGTMAFGRNPASEDRFNGVPFFYRQGSIGDLMEWMRHGLDLEAWVILHFDGRETWKQVWRRCAETIAMDETTTELRLKKADEKQFQELYERCREEAQKRAKKIEWKEILERFRGLDEEMREIHRKWLTHADQLWARKVLLHYLSVWEMLPLLLDDPQIAAQETVASTRDATVEGLTKLYREHMPEGWTGNVTDEEIVNEIRDCEQRGILSIQPAYRIVVDAEALRAYVESAQEVSG